MSEGIAEATAAEGIAAPRRHPLWDRLMPPGHRFVALWLAAGAATVSLLSAFTRQIIITALTLSDSVVSLTSHRGLGLLITRPGFLFPLAVFAVATATWLLFRHTSAPGVLALYFIASECVYCVLQLSSALANIPIARYIARAMSGTVGTDRGWWVGVVPSLAFPGVIIVGVATGTWLAWAMRGSRTGTRLSLADMVLGPDEDDAAGPETAPMVAVETPRSSDDGLASAFGWRGWRVAGADGIALGYPLTALIVGLVSHALSWITTMYAYSHLASNGSAFPIQSRGVSAALIGLGFVVYTAVYAVAIRRFGL